MSHKSQGCNSKSQSIKAVGCSNKSQSSCRARSRVETRHTLTNSSQGVYQVAQVVRVAAPSLHTSGPYTCKVATFTTEMTDTHTLLIFGELPV